MISTPIIENIEGIRNIVKDWKKNGLSVGFVPTMGALHEGHLSLIEKSKSENNKTVVSIFVNPIQFGPNEDYKKYPRQLEVDREKCQKSGVDLIFAPTLNMMYPEGRENITEIVPPDFFENKLCGKSRKGHFKGVTTVVAKLFNIVQPDRAYFGQKDAQQLIIIKKMCRDLNIPVEIISCPIKRDVDGLALSSRNAYLSEKSRLEALSLNRALKIVENLYNSGEKNAAQAISEAKKEISSDISIEYFEAYDYNSFEETKELKAQTLIAIAAKVDNVRLIDNIILEK